MTTLCAITSIFWPKELNIYITKPGSSSDHQSHIFNCFFHLSLHVNWSLKINISETESPVIFSKKKFFFCDILHLSKWPFSSFSFFFFLKTHYLMLCKILWILSSKIYPQPVISHCYSMTTEFHLISSVIFCHILTWLPDSLLAPTAEEAFNNIRLIM